MTRRFGLLLSALLLAAGASACASVSHAPETVSAEAKTSDVPEGRGSVILYRRGRAVGAALATQIKINGTDAGGTGPGTFFRWDLTPGSYAFSASSNESSATVRVDVEAGRVYFIEQMERLGLQSGRVQLQTRDEATGKSQIQGLKLLVSPYPTG